MKPVTTDTPGQPTKKRGVLTVGELRCVSGRMTRLPKDFEFPSAGVQDLWMQWNTPNTKRNILALCTLGPADFAWMDNRDKTLNERRLAKGKLKRRPVWKTLCDIKFLCNFIEETAVKEGFDPTDKVGAKICSGCVRWVWRRSRRSNPQRQRRRIGGKRCA